MNFTMGSTTLNNTWKHIRLPYVATACAVALAASAVVGSGGLLEGTSTPAASMLRPVPPVEADQYRPPTTYFLVDTQEQAGQADLMMGEHNALVLSGYPGLAPYEIVFAGTPAEAKLADATAASWGDYALIVRLVDLRSQ